MWIKRLFCHQTEELPWLGFSLSQNHSCANYSFHFEVHREENGRYYVTGECPDKKGYHHTEEKGIRLRNRTVEALGRLRLEQLPEDVPREMPRELAEVMILDEMTRHFSVKRSDGSFESKIIPEEMFLDIAQLLNAYFRKW
jgi:hypothetical protein